MPIEFRCNQCQKLLRTPDDSAGKQAKCPQCGTILTVPVASETGGTPTPPPQSSPFGDLPPAGSLPPLGGLGTPSDTGTPNPYQAPTSMPGFAPLPATKGGRNGPPWERDGASVHSFIETIKETFSSPADFYLHMRREGGMGSPLGYGVIAGSIGVLVATLYNFALQGIMGAAAGGEQMAVMLGGGALGLGLNIVIAPIAMIIGMFLWSAIYHLMLMMLGGANYGFETTFRVVAYTMGSTAMLSLVPCVGGCANFIAFIVFAIIGLSNTQDISGGKASAAVLVPFAVCCVAVGALYAVIIAVVVGAANQ